MAISSRQLGLIISEIASDLRGGMIRNIDQPNINTLLFEIAQGANCHRLLFSAHRNFARTHLVQKKSIRPKIPPGFCQLLRAHLRHKRIEILQQLADDRIIEMRCRWPGEDTKTIRFMAELTGTTANFYLLDAGGGILGMLFQAPPSRKLLKGTVYTPPAKRESPHFQETQVPPLTSASFPISRAFEAYFSELEEQEDTARQKKENLSRFETTIRRFRKRLARFEARLQAAEKSLKYRDYGEYLKCHLQEITPGVTSFIYADPATPDQAKIEVKLNPALSAAQNMAQFFRRYKKGATEIPMHRKRIQETQADLHHLFIGKDAFEKGETLPLSNFPLLSAPEKPLKKAQKKRPPTYLSSDNLQLMVGRNRLENEEITFHLARGNDFWFHARGVPGSHLVVKMEKRQTLPFVTLLEAATLALHFSRYRKEGKGEVMYTHKKYLQRPKKGQPGEVICAQEKTLYIEIDPTRLSKVLGNRMYRISE